MQMNLCLALCRFGRQTTSISSNVDLNMFDDLESLEDVRLQEVHKKGGKC